MSVPTQRDPAGPDTGAWRLLEAINRVDDSVRNLAVDMAAKFDKLDERFITRREAESRFTDGSRDRADLRAQIELAKSRHDADIARLETDADAAERRRIADRRWAVGVLLTILGLALTLLGLVVPMLVR